MSRVLGLALALSFLTGCVTYSVPPRSDLSVEAAASPFSVQGAEMGVVFNASAIILDDESAVRSHLGEGEPREVLRAFIAEHFPRALKEEAPFGTVFLAPNGQPTVSLTGTVEVDGQTPDLVLVVDSLHQYRAKYPTNNPMGGGSFTQAVRQDVDYRLWDNRTGRLVARGRVESEESIFMVPTAGAYRGAVEEMAEKLTDRLGVRTR